MPKDHESGIKEENDTPRGRGRPRRLELDKIIAAALQIGLNNLTMTSLAKHLGVGKAVLYGYVANREELVRIASSRAASRYMFPADEAEHWAVWTLRYCQALYDVLSQDGEMLELWLSGQQSSVIEIDAIETWMRVYTKAGFDPLRALHLRNGASQLVIGAASSAKRARAQKLKGKPRSQLLPKLIAGRSKDVAPWVHLLQTEIARDDQGEGWEQLLYWMLCGGIGYFAENAKEEFNSLPLLDAFQKLPELIP